MDDPNFWIVASIIAGAFCLWLIADYFIAKFIRNIIGVGMVEDDGDD